MERLGRGVLYRLLSITRDLDVEILGTKTFLGHLSSLQSKDTSICYKVECGLTY